MHARKHRVATLSLITALALLASIQPAAAHAERDAAFPDGTGKVPKYRPLISEPNLVVCGPNSGDKIRKIKDKALRKDNLKLLRKCRFRQIQPAINAVKKKGTTIYVLPGVYKEKPSRAEPECAAAFEGRSILTYEEQLTCPYAQNLIGVFGDIKPGDDERECNSPVCNLQIEGTGQKPEDVLIIGGFKEDGDWVKLNGIRGDRSDGLYLRNFTIQLFEFNAIYILETDGFVIDKVLARWNDEYGFLTFAVDHGLYKNCSGYNNGDSLVYPGSASDVNSDSEEYSQTERWAIEVKNCKSHHNALGYSGTAGNSVYVHDSEFYANQSGMVTDSIYPNHPGLPQDHSWWRNNKIYSNNSNYTAEFVHSGICDLPPAERGYKPPKGEPKWSGTVCPTVPAPVGAGMVIAGGNWNLIEDNQMWDNWRAGVMLFSVPAALCEEEDPEKAYDTSHFNMFVGNIMGLFKGDADLNGFDFWWDDQGDANCWEDNLGPDESITSNTMYPGGLPTCEAGGSAGLPNNPYKSGQLAPCAVYDRDDPVLRDPPGCTFFDTPPEP